MMRLLLESTVVDLHTTSMISQKLVEGAYQASETWNGLFTLSDCAKGFESMFAKEDFDILLEHRQWDHAIELVPVSQTSFRHISTSSLTILMVLMAPKSP